MTQNEQKVTLSLSIQQLNTILAAIVKLPIEVALDTFSTVQQQAQQQLGAPTMENPNAPRGPLADKVIQ